MNMNKGYLHDNGMALERTEINFNSISNVPTRLAGRTFGGIGTGNTPKAVAQQVIADSKNDRVTYLRKTDNTSGIYGYYYMCGESSSNSDDIVTVHVTFCRPQDNNGSPVLHFYILTFTYNATDTEKTVINASKSEYTVTLTVDT